jgi:hypothetical protein
MTENDRFLVYGDLAAAQARSAEAATALNWRHQDHAMTGSYWWEVIPLIDGGGAVVIQPTDSGAFDEHHKLDDGTEHGLTPKEIKQLRTYDEIKNLLPPPPSGRE